MSEARRVRGHFLGRDDDDAVTVRLELRTTDRTSWVTIAPLTGEGGREIGTGDPHIAHHLHEISLAMAAESDSARTPDPKAPKRRRRKPPAPVICPTCLGNRSYDCETCEGAGQVAAS